MYRVKELREKRAKLHEDAKGVLKAAADGKRELTAEERQKVDAIYADVDVLKGDIDREERAAAEEATLATSAGRKSESILIGDGRPSADLALRAWLLHPDRPEAITDEMRASCEAHRLNPASKTFDLRALSVGTTTAGGNSIPNEMMRAFMEIEKWYGRVQNLATVVNTDTGATLPWPTVDDTSNTGELLTETTGATTTADPSFGVVNLSSYKMSSKAVLLSVELLQDSSINLPAYLGAALGTRLGRIKNTYFTTGSGSSQPAGVQIKASLGKTAAATNAIIFDEVIDLYHSLDIAYRQGPSTAFMMNDAVAAYVRKLKDSQNRYLWEMSTQVGQPDRLIGVPVVINNDQDSAFSTNKRLILFGDFSKFIVRLAGGVVIGRTDDLYFLSDQVAFKGMQRVDSNLIDTTSVKYLRTA
jgi:HK97 family phage major capsid protein